MRIFETFGLTVNISVWGIARPVSVHSRMFHSCLGILTAASYFRALGSLGTYVCAECTGAFEPAERRKCHRSVQAAKVTVTRVVRPFVRQMEIALVSCKLCHMRQLSVNSHLSL